MEHMKLHSILNELETHIKVDYKDALIENRALHVIASASHLMKSITDNYDERDTDYLIRGLVLAIKSGDESKFSRRLKRLKDGTRHERTDE